MNINDKIQNNMVKYKSCKASLWWCINGFLVLWLSSQWAPCCSIVLSCGWMRSSSRGRGRLWDMLHSAGVLAVSTLQTGKRAHCSRRTSIDPARYFIQCLINAASHLTLAPWQSRPDPWLHVPLEFIFGRGLVPQIHFSSQNFDFFFHQN